MNKKDLIDFGEWLRKNFTTIQGGWQFCPYNREVKIIRSNEIVEFYLFVIKNFTWKENKGLWFEKNKEITIGIYLTTLYKIYLLQLK